MRPELETYQRIDSYLNGKLEGEALHTFEAQLKSDPAFAEEVSFQQLTNDIVVGASYNDLRSQMTKDIDRIDTADKTKTWSLYTVAAFILITGSAGIYYYMHNNTQHVKQIHSTELNPTINSSSSNALPEILNTPDSKKIRSEREDVHTTQTPGSSIKESAMAKTDPETTAVSSTHIQQHNAPEKTIQDVITTPSADKTPLADPCLNTIITAEITTKPSCINENTGSILISSTQVHGGTQPYTLSLDHTSAKPIKESYLYLSSGSHTVLITDKNGCSKEFHCSIPEKNCRKTSYVFAPEKGESWKISVMENNDFTITILNIAGTEVYKSQMMQGDFEWQGIGQHGEYLSAGLYIYVIEYTNGQKENGQVTIVR